MMLMKPTLLILAAGMGSRYSGLKQVDPVGPHGEFLLDYAIYDAVKAGFGKVVFVITKKMEVEFKKLVSSRYVDVIKVDYAFQELGKVPSGFVVPDSRIKPWGTGHAVLVAKDVINEPFAVANSDDYYGPTSYITMCNALKEMKNDSKEFIMVGFEVEKTLSSHGKVSRAVCSVLDSYLVSIIEREEIQEINGRVVYKERNNTYKGIEPGSLVSLNFWGFSPYALFPILEEQFEVFIKEHINSPKAEFYIPFAVDYAIKTQKAKVKVLKSAETWFGLTYTEDKAKVQENIRRKIKENIYPDNLFHSE